MNLELVRADHRNTNSSVPKMLPTMAPASTPPEYWPGQPGVGCAFEKTVVVAACLISRCVLEGELSSGVGSNSTAGLVCVSGVLVACASLGQRAYHFEGF
jgi:hypothetical protein